MVPPSVQLLLKRAIEFRAGSGLAGITIGSLKLVRREVLQHRQNPSGDCQHRTRLCLPTGHYLK